MIIAIDFDGTICTGRFPAIDGLQPYAKQIIDRLYNDGHYLIINTCRSGQQLIDAVNWMLANDIKFHRVNDNRPKEVEMYNNNSRKVYAHLYIDDKQVGGLPTWPAILAYVNELEEKWKVKTEPAT